MSQRRMFSPDIVSSDEFLTMPVSSRELYFQLGMNADDDGFIQPKMTMRIVGATDDDLKVLLAKRFLLIFESGVVVIKHWLINNMIRGDRYKPTRFQEEKKLLKTKENKAYTELDKFGCQNVNQMAPQVRLGKVRIDNTAEQSSATEHPKKEEIQKPFVLEEKLKDMEKIENSAMDIIASFIREKNLKIENSKQLSNVITRYIRVAQKLSGAYTNKQIFYAVDKIKKDNEYRAKKGESVVDFTLETVYKQLTK